MVRKVLIASTKSILLGVLISGCQESPNKEGTLEEAARSKSAALTTHQLKHIHMAYASFCDANAGKPPTNLEDITPFMGTNAWPEEAAKRGQECLQALKDGKYSVVWGLRDLNRAKKGTDIVHVYETQARKTAGLVLFADFRVEWMAASDLEKVLESGTKQKVP